MFQTKYIISLSLLVSFLVITSTIKNKTRVIEKQISNLDTKILLKKKNINEAQLDFYYLTSPAEIEKKLNIIGFKNASLFGGYLFKILGPFTKYNKIIKTNMESIFSTTPFNQDISNWDVSNATNMSGLFRDTPFNQDLSNWDVSNVTKMIGMFRGTPFNQDLSNWNVSNVSNMQGMFHTADKFNQDISSWNVSKIEDMDYTFGDSSFNQDISGWDVSNITLMQYMFFDNKSFNQDLSSWNVNKVVNCEYFRGRADAYVLPIPNFTLCNSGG